MKMTSDGQVTIPADIRRAAGLTPDIEVECSTDGDVVRLSRVAPKLQHGRGTQAVALLRGCDAVVLSTDQVMALTRGD